MKLDLITNKADCVGKINPNDEFYTPDYAIRPIAKYLRPNSLIWCPFDTQDSNFVRLLMLYSHGIYNTHISDGADFFLQEPPQEIDYIISNPPYSIKFEVFERLFKLGVPFAMLVGVVGLFESKKRFELFRDNDFEIMYFDKRVSYFRDYTEQKPSLNPPFSSVYVCSKMLPKQIIFEKIIK